MVRLTDQGEGGDALIHLRVPGALKACWVAASRREGKKLTDWIVENVEARMNVFKVPDALASKYHGAGLALAASLNGALIDFAYVDDLLPDFGGDVADARAAINDPRLGPAVRSLQTLGEVHVGMLSGWEFVEL